MRQLICILVFLLPLSTSAQREGGIWFWGGGYAMNTNASPAAPGAPPLLLWGGNYAATSTYSHTNGTLWFYVRLTSVSEPMVFRANGASIAGSDLMSDHGGNSNNGGGAIIIPRSGYPNQFYIFHSLNNGLFYSLLDMSLNGGLGGIVQKNVPLLGYGTIVPGRTVAVKGCNCIWFVARSRIQNEYLSFRVSAAGIDHTPMISPIGLLPMIYYSSGATPCIKSSPDGTKIATYGSYGSALELYDFEKCSGRVYNARLIDTLHNPPPSANGEREHYTGIAFSENSKLMYIARHRIWTTDSVVNGEIFGGKKGIVVQYDLTQPTTTGLMASAITVLENPYIYMSDLSGCRFHIKLEFQDIKRGGDGKIYVFNNVSVPSCNPSYSPTYSTAPAWHIINQPDNFGLLCQPLYNVIPSSSLSTFNNLPPDLALPPPPPDTIKGVLNTVLSCFKDNVIIKIPSSALCPRWSDGGSDSIRSIRKQDIYLLGYFKNDCTYVIDTFKVTFVKVPILSDNKFVCPGTSNGFAILKNAPGDTTHFSFEWKTSAGTIVRSVANVQGDTCNTLDTGINTVRVSTPSGCDTILAVLVNSLPVPEAAINADSVICANETILFLSSGSHPVNKWYFDKTGKYLPGEKVSYSYHSTGKYLVRLVVSNVEGCTDTADHIINVKDLAVSLIASKNPANLGEQVILTASATSSFQVFQWEPSGLFLHHNLLQQTVKIDSTTKFYVAAVSEDGCKDTAYLEVSVNPVVFIPTAFSPNNDGVNDYFRPLGAGAKILIRRLEVYNRWGQLIFMAYKDQAAKGWDGSYNNKPCDVGTYFYSILIETPSGENLSYKGDITLLR